MQKSLCNLRLAMVYPLTLWSKMVKKLVVGQRGVFRAYSGKIITGKVVSKTHNCYLVIGDDDYCGMYGDGLFRFDDSHVVESNWGKR
jgi:hypothetical protein